MPFDPPFSPQPQLRQRSTRPVALWLFILCGMILVMVSLGGATRLTGSGLSIMEWAPIMGALPPMSDAEWHRLFALYQQIPQYDLVNHGFGLAGFKGIFWLEWTHRFWGRLMGLVFIVPLAWFAATRRITRALALRLFGLLVLGGLQGAVGWIMVASGFEADSTAVSPYRLVAHLALAVTLYAAILWTALGLWRQQSPLAAPRDRTLARLVAVVAASVALTILAGGFVAGTKAGFTYNTFPLMDGHVIPPGYASLTPWVRNLFENIPAVQFDHRLLATFTALFALATAVIGMRRSIGPARTALHLLAVAVTAQYALGVATLLWAVPVALGAAHQAMAMLLLTASLVSLHILRAPARPAMAASFPAPI